jgi:hypothetical protein
MTVSISAADGLKGLPGPTGRFTHRRASVTSEKQPGSSGWHPFQPPSCITPKEGLTVEPLKTGVNWEGANVRLIILAKWDGIGSVLTPA